MKKNIIKYSVTFLFGAIIAFLVFLIKNIFGLTKPDEIFKVLSDGCFVAGVFLSGYGLLVLASNGGTFDMIAYGVKMLFSVFQSAEKRKLRKSFYEYRKTKQENKRSFAFLIFVGLFFILLTVIFTLLFYKYYVPSETLSLIFNY